MGSPLGPILSNLFMEELENSGSQFAQTCQEMETLRR